MLLALLRCGGARQAQLALRVGLHCLPDVQSLGWDRVEHHGHGYFPVAGLVQPASGGGREFVGGGWTQWVVGRVKRPGFDGDIDYPEGSSDSQIPG